VEGEPGAAMLDFADNLVTEVDDNFLTEPSTIS